ncbi:MAG TPA: hypothetical protein VEI54_07310 [Candidatus Limnocylindrales bacterium]|nr:hypothetical protein [Candidatus Limnocylindrales bacterium]
MVAKTWLLSLTVVATVGVVLLLLYQPKIGELFHTHVKDRPKRRMLLAAIGFFVTFAVARAMAYGAYRNTGPFHYVYVGRTHIHHLVLGILLLLVVGFCWLVEVGTGAKSSSLLASRLMSLLYGVAAALTLDEFALWLNVEEGIYWTRRDIISLDAVLLFGAALVIGIWGKDFLKAAGVEVWTSRKRRRQRRQEKRRLR